MEYLHLAEKNEAYTLKIRRHLHENPELTSREVNTLRFLRGELDRLGVEYVEVPHGGIFGFIRGKSASEKRTLLLRADMDALPVEEAEENLLGPKRCLSKVPGTAHVCGHDAHTAMLLTAAKILSERREELPGDVILMFERGEEGGENCYFLLQYLLEHRIKIDGCWAMHMAPMVDSGKMAILDGGVMAGLCAYDVSILGKGGHGSRPDLCNNALDCCKAILAALDSVRMREISPFQVLTYSTCLLDGSPKINIIPGEARFGGTARFYEKELVGEPFRKAFFRICEHICAAYGCTAQVHQFLGPLTALKNHPQCAAMAREFVGRVLGAENVVACEPLMGSESMAEVHLYYPGVFCLLGTKNPQKGCGADMHHPQFDVDEDVLKLGVASTLSYAVGFLESREEIRFTPYSGELRALYSDAVDQLALQED